MSTKPKFFVDRGLGREIVPNAIRGLGYEVFLHDDLFAQDTPDTEWLPAIGKLGYVFLSKDVNISRNAIEVRAIVQARL